MLFTRRDDQSEADFLSHFIELRRRLMYCLLAVCLGLIVGWLLYPRAYALIAGPILQGIHRVHGVVMTQHPAEGFFVRLKVSGVLGLIIASPVIIWQLWAFVSPGLTERERRAIRPIMPMVCVLFLFGAGLAHLVMPQVMAFFLAFIPKGVTPNINFEQSLNFPLKIYVSFGLAFELPVVVLGLVALRILTPRVLLAQWRIAVFLIAVIAAVITPTGDPFSVVLMMLPLLALYFCTILFAYRIVR